MSADVELVEVQTHLVGVFLLALDLFPACLARLCLVECVLGLRPQLVQPVLQRQIRFCGAPQSCEAVDAWRRTCDGRVGHAQLCL
jgi:hypothetical protein